MNTFPTDEGLIFIVCDDFRNEGAGKLSIFGILGDTVIVQQEAGNKTVMLSTLGLYASFRDGAGDFKMTLNVTDKDDKNIIPVQAAQKAQKVLGMWMNVALKLSPFIVPLGEYKFHILLEDTSGKKQTYTRTFRIITQVTQ